MNHKIIKLERTFLIKDPGRLCAMPYPGHPKGCPNLGYNANCPPNAPRIEEKYNLNLDCFLIALPFDIAAQKRRMKERHPEWSDRKAACCLYWQDGVRKILKIKCNEYRNDYCYKNNIRLFEELIPEAMGLNVFATMRWHGIKMYRNPQDILYKIAFMGINYLEG